MKKILEKILFPLIEKVFEEVRKENDRNYDLYRQEREQEEDPLQKVPTNRSREDVERFQRYYTKMYGDQFLIEVDTYYQTNSQVLTDLSDSFELYFPTNPANLQRLAIINILKQSPEEYKELRGLAIGIVEISNDFDISISQIVIYIGHFYRMSDSIKIPLIVVANYIMTEFIGFNYEDHPENIEKLATAEIILNIAVERVEERYNREKILVNEFSERLHKGKINSCTFKELLPMRTALESIIKTVEMNGGVIDSITTQSVETIKEYTKIYIDFISEDETTII